MSGGTINLESVEEGEEIRTGEEEEGEEGWCLSTDGRDGGRRKRRNKAREDE